MLTGMEREILEEVAGMRTPRPWGGAVGACLESLRSQGYITKTGRLTEKGLLEVRTTAPGAYRPMTEGDIKNLIDIREQQSPRRRIRLDEVVFEPLRPSDFFQGAVFRFCLMALLAWAWLAFGAGCAPARVTNCKGEAGWSATCEGSRNDAPRKGPVILK